MISTDDTEMESSMNKYAFDFSIGQPLQTETEDKQQIEWKHISATEARDTMKEKQNKKVKVDTTELLNCVEQYNNTVRLSMFSNSLSSNTQCSEGESFFRFSLGYKTRDQNRSNSKIFSFAGNGPDFKRSDSDNDFDAFNNRASEIFTSDVQVQAVDSYGRQLSNSSKLYKDNANKMKSSLINNKIEEEGSSIS